MDRIELHDVEYGDCTVLVGRDQSVLMVDCGSVSQYTRQDGVAIDARFDSIFRRYTAAAERHFLLTHYHRDHMNGFLRKLRQDPNYFDRVYIPAIPGLQDKNPMLDLAVFAHFFAVPQSNFAQVNTACLTIFELLCNTVGAERIFTLRAGDIFSFDDTRYAVLSPEAEDFPYDPLLCDAVSELNAALAVQPEAARFLQLKSSYIETYQTCGQAFSPSDYVSADHRRRLSEQLIGLWHTLENLRGTLEHLPAIQTVRAILSGSALRAYYTETQNDLSLIFHNIRTRTGDTDILMPGDASGTVLDRLTPKLYDGYYAVKAPHHGTESHYPAVFQDMAIAHLLISNGEYRAGSAVSERYASAESIKHCTNRMACAWFTESGSCCNRLLRCWEQPAPGVLTLKCAAAAGNRRTPCGIYVFGHNGVHGCHCDRL